MVYYAKCVLNTWFHCISWIQGKKVFFRLCCHCKQIISLYLQSRKAKFNYKLHLSYQSGIIYVLFLPGTKQNNSNWESLFIFCPVPNKLTQFGAKVIHKTPHFEGSKCVYGPILWIFVLLDLQIQLYHYKYVSLEGYNYAYIDIYSFIYNN